MLRFYVGLKNQYLSTEKESSINSNYTLQIVQGPSFELVWGRKIDQNIFCAKNYFSLQIFCTRPTYMLQNQGFALIYTLS